jgi:hypothetical protein
MASPDFFRSIFCLRLRLRLRCLKEGIQLKTTHTSMKEDIGAMHTKWIRGQDKSAKLCVGGTSGVFSDAFYKNGPAISIILCALT